MKPVVDIRTMLETLYIYDVMFNNDTLTDKGWKLSISGKSIDDALYLYEKLSTYLIWNKIPFKVGTVKRINHSNSEQAHKIFTIYVPNDLNVYNFAETVYDRISEYKGWYDIKDPSGYEFYAGGIYIRNDRDEYGNYIPVSAIKM